MQEARLQKANASLAEAQAQLDDKQKELDVVQAKFDAAMGEKQVKEFKSCPYPWTCVCGTYAEAN